MIVFKGGGALGIDHGQLQGKGFRDTEGDRWREGSRGMKQAVQSGGSTEHRGRKGGHERDT